MKKNHKLIITLVLIFNHGFIFKSETKKSVNQVFEHQIQDTTFRDSLYLVLFKDVKGFKYTPTRNEVALVLSFKYSLNPIWTPSDSIILEFEDSLDTILKRNPQIYFRQPLNEYVRQYVGLTDSQGRKLMVILFNYYKDSKDPRFGKFSNYNSSLKLVYYSISGLNRMLVYDIKEKKLSSLSH